jgi:hypothetical protein
MAAHSLFSSSLPELYERFLVGPLFRVFSEELIDRVGLAEDNRILDVACGTERHLGPVVDQRHSLGDANIIRGLLADAGLRGIAVETITCTVRMSGGADTSCAQQPALRCERRRCVKRFNHEETARQRFLTVTNSPVASSRWSVDREG